MKRSAPSESYSSRVASSGDKNARYGTSSKKAVYQLAFPKGTCVLRFADLSPDNGTNTIWLIENHILIRKLEPDGSVVAGMPTYFRVSNRYQGWYYDEPWNFMPLTTVSNTKNVEEALMVIYPTNEMIQHGYELAERLRLHSTSKENSARLQLERKIKQLKSIRTRHQKNSEMKDEGCIAAANEDGEDGSPKGEEELYGEDEE